MKELLQMVSSGRKMSWITLLLLFQHSPERTVRGG